MLRIVTLFSISVLLLPLLPAISDAQFKQQPASSSNEYQALLDEYDDVGGARAFAGKFFAFARQHSKEPAAVDALAWIATHLRYKPDAARAIGLLKSKHLRSPRLAKVCGPIAKGLTPAAERFLQAALKTSPHPDVRAQACFHLVALLDGQMRLADEIKQQPAIRKRAQQYYGKEMTDHLVSLDARKVERRKERLCETMLKSFAKAPTADGVMGDFAKKTLFAMRNLSVGKQAPEIEGDDIDGRSFKLSAYHGKVVMLSFWGHW